MTRSRFQQRLDREYPATDEGASSLPLPLAPFQKRALRKVLLVASGVLDGCFHRRDEAVSNALSTQSIRSRCEETIRAMRAFVGHVVDQVACLSESVRRELGQEERLGGGGEGDVLELLESTVAECRSVCTRAVAEVAELRAQCGDISRAKAEVDAAMESQLRTIHSFYSCVAAVGSHSAASSQPQEIHSVRGAQRSGGAQERPPRAQEGGGGLGSCVLSRSLLGAGRLHRCCRG